MSRTVAGRGPAGSGGVVQRSVPLSRSAGMSAAPITHRRSGCLRLGVEVGVGVRVRARARARVRVRVRVRFRVRVRVRVRVSVRVRVRLRVRLRVSVSVSVRVRARVGVGRVPLVTAREVAAAHDDGGATLGWAARGRDERGDRGREVLEGATEGAVLLAVEGHLG